MNNTYTITITDVISDGARNIHGFGVYHFKANVYSREHTFGERDVYLLRDLPTMGKMRTFNYDFNNRTMDVTMEPSENGSFNITTILNIAKNPSDE